MERVSIDKRKNWTENNNKLLWTGNKKWHQHNHTNNVFYCIQQKERGQRYTHIYVNGNGFLDEINLFINMSLFHFFNYICIAFSVSHTYSLATSTLLVTVVSFARKSFSNIFFFFFPSLSFDIFPSKRKMFCRFHLAFCQGTRKTTGNIQSSRYHHKPSWQETFFSDFIIFFFFFFFTVFCCCCSRRGYKIHNFFHASLATTEEKL